MFRALVLLALLAGCGPQVLKPGDPLSGTPVPFMEPSGQIFTADRLLAITKDKTLGAPIPPSARVGQSEDRIDLGFVPLVGDIFGRRVSPGDAKRDGFLIGPVYRDGSALVMDLGATETDILTRRLIITTLVQRDKPVRFDLGTPRYEAIPAVRPVGDPVGRLYLLAGQLVIASEKTVPSLLDYFNISPYAN
ncbi:MAG: hypothetical protein AAGD47_06345 [Pseudomonadota bacterium]